MGYTHYFRMPKGTMKEDKWKRLCKDVQTLVGNENYPVEKGYDRLDIGEQRIIVKGTCEWLVIERESMPQFTFEPEGMVFNFCKTRQHPYDYVVVACLIALKRILPQVELSSDGDLIDWHEGIAHFRENISMNHKEADSLSNAKSIEDIFSELPLDLFAFNTISDSTKGGEKE